MFCLETSELAALLDLLENSTVLSWGVVGPPVQPCVTTSVWVNTEERCGCFDMQGCLLVFNLLESIKKNHCC